MKFDWKPNKENLTGTVTVNLPKYAQRLRYIKDANLKLESDGTVSPETDMIGLTIAAVELAEKHIESVNLTGSDGKKYESVDDLQYDAVGSEILSEVGFLVINGPQLGNH